LLFGLNTRSPGQPAPCRARAPPAPGLTLARHGAGWHARRDRFTRSADGLPISRTAGVTRQPVGCSGAEGLSRNRFSDVVFGRPAGLEVAALAAMIAAGLDACAP
jgi:hypothetical protein